MKIHFGFVIAGVVFLIDRLSKFWMVDSFDLAQNGPVPVFPFFDFTLVWNRGISLGLFQMDGEPGRWALIVLTGLVTLVVAFWLLKASDKFLKIGLGLVLGGAIGNIWDRFYYGAVADFMHFYVGDWSFYIFNVADAAITVGVIILLWDALLSPQKKNKKLKT